MKKFSLILVFVAALFAAQSCSDPNKNQVLIPYPNWAEGIAVTHLAKVALESSGHTINIKAIEPGPIFASLAKGDADVFMDAWLPYTHKDYFDKFGDKVEILGSVFDNGTTGLVVPAYVTINSIEELNDNKEQFQGKIFGIGSGAGIHASTLKAIESYALDYQQVTSSETSMLAVLKKAELNKEWVVITGWKPHIVWSQYDLKYLEDTKEVYPKDEIQILCREGFSVDQPEIAHFLKNFKLTEELLYELMTTIDNEKNALQGAEKFYAKHKNLIESWKK